MHHRYYYLLCLLWGYTTYAEPFFQKPEDANSVLQFTEFGKSVIHCLNLRANITPTEFVKFCQNRIPDDQYDIWDNQNYNPEINCSPEDLYDLLKRSQWIDEKRLPFTEHFDCILIMGGIIPGMRDRIYLVLNSFRKSQIKGEPKVCFLTSNRLLKNYDGKGFIQELQEHEQQEPKPQELKHGPTESIAGRYLWEGIFPSRFKCEFINTTLYAHDGVTTQNVGTKEVITSWINWFKSQKDSRHWKILLVGSQPWAHHQYLTCKYLLLLHFPEFFNNKEISNSHGVLDFIGIGAPSLYMQKEARRSEGFKINILWHSIALTVCMEKEVFELEKSLMAPSGPSPLSSGLKEPPSSPATAPMVPAGPSSSDIK
ncbi:MAG: hypothetical protein LBG98_01565 [Puniceicoccales bacterium]|jgi:hypothetical protein|nr:hypothetical protein [Puniceicoccales bacterium]